MIGNSEGKRPGAKLLRRWNDNTKMKLRQFGGKLWTGSIRLRLGIGGGLS